MPPLERAFARSYCDNNELFVSFEAECFDKMIVSAPLGINAIDFCRCGANSAVYDAIEDILHRAFDYCRAADGKVLDGMDYLDACISEESTLKGCVYAAAVLAVTAEYLIEDEEKVASSKAVYKMLGEDWLGEHLHDRFSSENERAYIDKVCTYFVSRRPSVETFLHVFYDEDSKYPGCSPFQKLYLSENYNDSGTRLLAYRFLITLDIPFEYRALEKEEIIDAFHNTEIALHAMFHLESVDDVIRYEIIQMLRSNIVCRRCRNCNLFFVPTGRIDSVYCSYVPEGETRTCKEFGASRLRNQKVSQDPVLLAYKQAYNRMSAQRRLGRISTLAFNSWNYQAMIKRDECLSGKTSLEDFVLWLDQTRKNRKRSSE